MLAPSASGTVTYDGNSATIDASNTAEGYVMAKYEGSVSKIKIQITGPNDVTYTYNLHPGWGYETFPLTSGSGGYTVNILENISGTQYALALGQSISVSLRSSLLPYLYPSQYVNFSSKSTAVSKGAELTRGLTGELEKVQKVYNYVVKNISYDFDKASTVTSGYLPSPDSTLSAGKGICFDYAALMATMLRTQAIPTRLEIGYVSGGIYHAWISVYTNEQGWINGIIQFDGQDWKLMDPTFASSGNSSGEIMSFIGNESNYSIKYIY
ncbi:MAG TPA: transglutaminase-like domain-containing protein [Oscillospiraceae bacterium]|nr:transglutaminase-like domain-containing protein [Oscillospiraceae bacterium]